MKFEWEEIESLLFSSTRRAKVPGGWLVRYEGSLYGENTGYASMAFVPDELHTWVIT